MGCQLGYIQQIHTKTKRDYIGRMDGNKIDCMKVAKKFGKDFWDGDRSFGYGGYIYDGRWEELAINLINRYSLDNNSAILDIGCGKGFLLYEFKKLLPNIKISGFDISEYAIENSKEEVRENLFVHKAEDILPFGNKQFDLTISLNALHNLKVYSLKTALSEMNRVSKNAYLVVEAYRNEAELFNLECWALTCESFFRPDEWIWLYNEFGYGGDYEFIYFE